jgi:serine/threonine protein phosphatase PrpC
MHYKVEMAHLSLPGRKHKDKGQPNEDAYMNMSENGVHVICVSDGAGGSQYTHAHIGSQSIVKTVSELMVKHFDAFFYDVRENVVRSILVTAIQSELAIIANENGISGLEKMSATMLFCAIKDSRMICGHIGDGLIAKVSSSGMTPITIPQNGEDSTSTYFITFPDAQDYLRIVKTTTDDVHAIVLITDGISDLVYDSSTLLIRPVVARLAEIACLPEKEKSKQLLATISNYVIESSPLSDDATIGILYLCGTTIPDIDTFPSEKTGLSRDYKDEMRNVQMEILPRVKLARSIVNNEGIQIDGVNVAAECHAKIEDENSDAISDRDEVSPKKKTIRRIFSKKSVYLLCLAGIVSITVIIILLIIL